MYHIGFRKCTFIKDGVERQIEAIVTVIQTKSPPIQVIDHSPAPVRTQKSIDLQLTVNATDIETLSELLGVRMRWDSVGNRVIPDHSSRQPFELRSQSVARTLDGQMTRFVARWYECYIKNFNFSLDNGQINQLHLDIVAVPTNVDGTTTAMTIGQARI